MARNAPESTVHPEISGLFNGSTREKQFIADVLFIGCRKMFSAKCCADVCHRVANGQSIEHIDIENSNH
jgi:hypothetical protein